MQIFNKNKKNNKIICLKEMPSEVIFNDGSPAILIMKDGKKKCASCLACKNKKCMYFNKYETEIQELSTFPFDKNNEVCPVGALTENENGFVRIDKNKCIRCGLCASRCPLGAIYHTNNNFEVSNNSELNVDEFLESNDAIKNQNLQLGIIDSIKHTGIIVQESDEIFSKIYQSLEMLHNKYHDQVVRNLLIGLGCSSGKRRIGDVYTRMDAIYKSADAYLGAVEVEFGKETLDASRAILDDIAMLNVRYNINKSDNKPLVVCLHLPNARQGYWQVIKDIYNVENIKINTMSIGALLILIWNLRIYNPKDNGYYIDYDNKNLRDSLENQLRRKINVSIKHLGIFEPNK